MGKLELICQR